jgi:hypothetical protein
MDRQQLDRRHAEPAQMSMKSGSASAANGAALVRTQIFAQHAQAAQMHLRR